MDQAFLWLWGILPLLKEHGRRGVRICAGSCRTVFEELDPRGVMNNPHESLLVFALQSLKAAQSEGSLGSHEFMDEERWFQRGEVTSLTLLAIRDRKTQTGLSQKRDYIGLCNRKALAW